MRLGRSAGRGFDGSAASVWPVLLGLGEPEIKIELDRALAAHNRLPAMRMSSAKWVRSQSRTNALAARMVSRFASTQSCACRLNHSSNRCCADSFSQLRRQCRRDLRIFHDDFLHAPSAHIPSASPPS